MLLCAILAISLLVVASSFRIRGAIGYQDTGNLSASRVQGQLRCQYSGAASVKLPGRRPPFSSMVAVCPAESPKCIAYVTRKKRRYQVADTSKITTADCENLCTQDSIQSLPKQANGNNKCLGYVLRDPFGEDLDQGAPQCFLIHGGALRSKTLNDEIHFDTVKNAGKKTFVKEYCGCSHRYVHIARNVEQTSLAIAMHMGAECKIMAEESSNATEAMKKDNATEAMKKDCEGNIFKALHLQDKLKHHETLAKFAGIYDWVPVTPPHRSLKGMERLVPTGLLALFKDDLKKQASLAKYWEAPVRVSSIYKKIDLSAILYRCMVKKTRDEKWYFTTKDEILEWLQDQVIRKENKTLDEDEMKEFLAEDTGAQISLFLNLECIGTPLSMENDLVITEGDKQFSVKVDVDFLSNREVTGDRFGKTPLGCFTSEADAVTVQEKDAINEVGRCPVDSLTWSASPSGIGEKINLAKKILTFKKTAKRLFKVGKAGRQAASAAKDTLKKLKNKAFTSFFKRNKQKTPQPVHEENKKEGHDEDGDDADGDPVDEVEGNEGDIYAPKKILDLSAEEFTKMLERADLIVGGLSEFLNRINAASNTEDEQIKLVCAKEALEEVFRIGGLLPKLMQNIAMQPKLVKDNFVRNKLKETQTNNPLRNETETMLNVENHKPMLDLGSKSVLLTDILEYKSGMSAGSVGQVDKFRIKKGLDKDSRELFKALLPVGHGDVVILKTVFEETKEAYETDWNILEQFFHFAGSRLPKTVQVVWTVLKPMKKSIFQEFDLRHEARFTKRGNIMLEEFTRNVNQGKYFPTLKTGDVTLTTPYAIPTSSPLFLIQSLAPGKPLKDHLEEISGQIEPLVEWRTKIYSSILLVFGHMVVKHGFFQSDPHNGNWFWDAQHKTITLIDWGGVEEFDSTTHCTLAQLYKKMGTKQSQWEECEAVELSGGGTDENAFSGSFIRSGVSIFDAGPGQQALIMGKTYEIAYENPHPTKKIHLWYDGSRWFLAKINPGNQTLYDNIAAFETNTSKLEDLAGTEVSFKRLGKKTFLNFNISKSTKDCGMTRRDAYATAGVKLGLQQEFTCSPQDLVFMPEGPLSPGLLKSWKDSGKRELKCIDRNKVPPSVKFGLYNPLELEVQNNGKHRFILMPDGANHSLEDEPVVSPDFLEGTDQIFEEASRNATMNLSSNARSALLNLLTNVEAAAVSLYDSDALTAVMLGLNAPNAVDLVFPVVPEVYTLLARCIAVFHGMLLDVIKESANRLIPMTYLQWFANSQRDRFFTHWELPAKEYFKTHNEEVCPEGSWKDIH